MPPKTQRSRACNQCRERRVKCDETPEICVQCRRLGLKCSGPIQGSVIIDMTDRVTKPRAQKKKSTKPPVVVRDNITREPLSAATKSRKPKLEPRDGDSPLYVIPFANHQRPITGDIMKQEDAMTAIRWQYKPPTLHQPSKAKAEALDLAFVSHFVELNRGVRAYNQEIPWLTHLPALHESALKPALRFSIRAASMAFYAKMHCDPTILVDSYRWYTVSLNAQRQSLAKLDGQSIPSTEEILVPIILGLYEVYAGTTSTSVLQHLTAAAEIIKMRGPTNCKSLIIYPMFKAMRVSDGHRAMIFNKPSIFSSYDWMTQPFENMTRNAHQDLADILLMIPDCVALCGAQGSLKRVFASPLPPSVDLKPCEMRILQLMRQLDGWAEQFPHLTIVSEGPQIVRSDMASLATSGAIPANDDATKMILPDSFVALTAATYKALRLTLNLLLHKITTHCYKLPSPPPDPTTPPYSPTQSLWNTANACAKSILEITSNMESKRPIGFDFMRSVFPLVVVAAIGPGVAEQKEASNIMERWGKQRGLGGLVNAWLDGLDQPTNGSTGSPDQ